MAVPYATATSGAKARDEITKLLARFGCADVGFMDSLRDHSVLLQFTHRGRVVQLRASGKGWAAMYLREKPWHRRSKKSKPAYEQKALEQGAIAINSILRDWVKGQVTAVECGMLSFEAVFMPHMQLSDGRSVLEHVQDRKMLPAPV